MLNPYIKPWNIYNQHLNPDLSVSGNVIIDGKEWYNSFMPCFFRLNEYPIIKKMQEEIQNKNLLKYQKLQNENFSKQKISNTIDELKPRTLFYFNQVEKRLFNIEPKNDNLIDNLGYVLAAINLMQLYLDPVESLTTNKATHFYHYPNLPTPKESVVTLVSCPSPEVAFIPLSITHTLKMDNIIIDTIKNYYLSIFGVEDIILNESLSYCEKTYHYTKFMSPLKAMELLTITVNKIKDNSCQNSRRKMINQIQEINGLMTWSKFILTQVHPLRRRYDSTNNVLFKILSLKSLPTKSFLNKKLKPETNAGSEKQGMLIYLIKHLFENNQSLIKPIVKKANEYYQYAIKI